MNKRFFAGVVLIAVVTVLFVPPVAAFSPAPGYGGVMVWFYNSAGWGNVSAYVWGEQGEVLGGWPGVPAEQNGESLWWSILINADTPFNLIFNNGGSSQAGGVYIEDNMAVYATVKADGLFGSREEAEASISDLPNVPVNEKNTVWFYNSNGWPVVYAYVYGTITPEPLGGWPGALAVRDGSTAWYGIEVPVGLPFNIIFNGGSDDHRATSYIRDTVSIYLTVQDDLNYDSREAAEAEITEVIPIEDPPSPPPPEPTPDTPSAADNQTSPGLTPSPPENTPPSSPSGDSGTLLTVIFIVAGVIAVCLTVAIIIVVRKKKR
jgi:hypothetical protein